MRVPTLSLVKIDEVLLFTVLRDSPKPVGDGGVGQTLGKQPQHVVLPRGQLRERVLVADAAPSRASTRCATAGPKIAWPSATAVTARRISSLVAPLSR